MRVLPLTGRHDRQGFDCSRQELNDWLRQVARQHQDKGLSKTFVAVREIEPTRICGYYALTLAELENRHLPDAWRKKLPRRRRTTQRWPDNPRRRAKLEGMG
jgi:hypothetical protein